MKTWSMVGVSVAAALVGAAGCARSGPTASKPESSPAQIIVSQNVQGMSGSSAAPPSRTPVTTAPTTPTTPSPSTPTTTTAPPTAAIVASAPAAKTETASTTPSTMAGALQAPMVQAVQFVDGTVRELPVTTNISRVTFAEEGADFDPSVSKDGSRVVFASTQHKTTSDIFIKRTDSRVVTQLTNDPAQDTMPTISPDGTKIAFTSDRGGNWDIYVMPITGGKAVQITGDTTDEIHPSWSPDGKQLVFCRMGPASGRWEMWVTDLQNPSVQNFIGYGLFPQWCPAAGTGEAGADRILFQLGRERGRRAFGIWTVDVTATGATNPTEISSSSTTTLINPAWSPDGKWIVYAEVPMMQSTDPSVLTNQDARRPNWATLWMLSIEGEGRVRLTSGPGVALTPTWSGNNRLFFVCDRSGAENVWSLDVTPAVAAAQATIGGNQPVTAHAPATAAPLTPVPEAPKTNTVANVPEGEAPSNVQPH